MSARLRSLDARNVNLESRLSRSIRINDASDDVWAEQKQKHAEYSIKGSDNYRQGEGTRRRGENQRREARIG